MSTATRLMVAHASADQHQLVQRRCHALSRRQLFDLPGRRRQSLAGGSPRWADLSVLAEDATHLREAVPSAGDPGRDTPRGRCCTPPRCRRRTSQCPQAARHRLKERGCRIQLQLARPRAQTGHRGLGGALLAEREAGISARCQHAKRKQQCRGAIGIPLPVAWRDSARIVEEGNSAWARSASAG